jgi:hypothetical protein
MAETAELPRDFSQCASCGLVMAAIQFRVDIPQLVFRPLPLTTIAGVFQTRAKFPFSGRKPLASLPIPGLRGWDGGDARYLKLNSFGMSRHRYGYGGMSRRQWCRCGEDESKR